MSTASQSLTILLLKETVTSIQAAIDPEKETTAHPLNMALGLPGALFLGKQTHNPPAWVELINPYLQTQIRNAHVAGISAILLVEYEGRIFAIAFGHGRSLLAASSWIRDFGLKVTLNRVDPLKLRSIDSRTYQDLVVSTRRQTSRSSKVDTFELDIARDLVRGVTGDARDTTLFKRLTGSDALTVTTPLPFSELHDLLDELLVAYSDTAYKQHFEWIDNVKEVDQIVREQLDRHLVEKIAEGTIEGMYLAPADILEWDAITGFSFTGGKRSLFYLELSLEDYVQILREHETDVSLELLRRHKIRVRYEGSENVLEPWSIYECIVWQTDLNGGKYVFFDGRWFEIDRNYATRVARFIGEIPASSCTLPGARLGQDEATYNESVEAADPTEFAMLDRQTVRATGAPSPIEFCDLLSAHKHLIHVKKRSSSATLSHLFSQGSVSSSVFLQDPGVREAVRRKLGQMGKRSHAALISRDRPTSSQFEVVFALLAKPGRIWPPRLPFFSEVNLMHHATLIRTLGYKVSLHYIRQV